MFPIFPTTPDLLQLATKLATRFNLPLVDTPDFPFLLHLTEQRLELHNQKTGPVYVDFVNGKLGYRNKHGGGRKQPLAKAIGLKHGNNPTVLDATAGLGRDAFILANLGCQVQMVERSPVIAALLYDGLQRLGNPANLQLIHQDAQNYLPISSPKPDIIYLDPMFPHRKKSALVKKEMQILQTIIGADTDAINLLTIALNYANKRVVVKRPKWATAINNVTPTFCINNVNTRFDIYLI
ncbi:class I SAM-dependent methyltransferase [Candidatus Halobeggiatoa sp. HSG11]|nr:class I SAM-dependent methyltransferase [Candidatus Halobeggiatoa sp. HSG11]